MMGVTLLGVVLIFLSVGLTMQTAVRWHCAPSHPQDQFCTSEIVILAHVTGIGSPVKYPNIFGRYKIKKVQVLKGSINADQIQYVYTDSILGVITLDHGRYVLSGNRAEDGIRLMVCGLVEQWDLLSSTEQENFSQTYKTGCNCTISTCSDSPCCPQSEKECKWETNSPQSPEYVCLKDSEGICSWYWQGSRVDEDAMCKV